MPEPLTGGSPLPLYHQIAEAIRYALSPGRLKEGENLTPVRRAAREWKVNLHTVRRAYAELAREGLVETRVPQGSRILARAAGPRPRAAERRVFARRVLREAAERFGLDAQQLAALLAEAAGPAARPLVHVVECSEAQCRGHADELEQRFEVEARPWPLARPDAPPPGPVVATYFHYNDVRRRWPARLSEVRFAAIRPDPALIAQLGALAPRARRTLVLCELDASMAENIAADLAPLLPAFRLELVTRVVADPAAGLAALGAGELALFSPRAWALLTPAQQADPRAHGIRYVFAEGELAALGSELGWRERSTALARGAS
jgi:GntR family transcriptional regulator